MNDKEIDILEKLKRNTTEIEDLEAHIADLEKKGYVCIYEKESCEGREES